ncbi:hypothetical protein [Pseudoalteromonas sp. Isolate6]|nr:hypothetical protein [Pseudoalteromonas sp. Isolate6]
MATTIMATTIMATTIMVTTINTDVEVRNWYQFKLAKYSIYLWL